MGSDEKASSKCKICKCVFVNTREDRKPVLSGFDYESRICGLCKTAEEKISTKGDERTRHEVHFAYITKNFEVWRNLVMMHRGKGSNFTKSEYLNMAVRMARGGSQPLRETIRHSRQFLRGITDFDDYGNYAWKKGEYAKNSYEFSENAWPHRELKNYNKVLHGEHIIPLKMVFDRWLELIDEGMGRPAQRSFLERHLIVVWITIAEQHRLDRDLGLRTKMPKGWSWGDDIYARLRVAGINPVRRT